MRRWERSPYDCQCGACGAVIPEGDPRLVITLPRVPPKPGTEPMNDATMKATPAPKIRCGRLACAEEPVPADLPPLAVHTRMPIAPVPKQSALDRRPLFALVEDWKTRALGREPGSDD